MNDVNYWGHEMSRKAPLWGNFVYYADHDLLSFGLLTVYGLMLPAMYHGTQALEKYLKALVLSIIDPSGSTETAENNPWLKTHDLVELANKCGQIYPYYTQTDVLDHLRRFTEFDQDTRYPWVNRKFGNGYSSNDTLIFEEIISHLRCDLPIIVDDYMLGIALRGSHHKHPDAPLDIGLQFAAGALRKVFKNADNLVHH